MGSIADKLNYLNETKQEIKQAIINKGVDVSDTDTFRSFADKIGSIEAGTTESALVPAILEGEWQEYYYTRYTIATGETADFSDTLTQPEILVFEGDKYRTYTRGSFGTNTDTYATRGSNPNSYTIEGTKVKYNVGLGDYAYYDYLIEDGVAILQQITETETSITTRKFKRILPQMKNLIGDATITQNGTYVPYNYESYGFSRVKVEVPSQEPNLIEKQITENGTYLASDDGADGYSAVSVNVPSYSGGSGERDENETMYEMQEADNMRQLLGAISRAEIPSEAEYLEQQEYVNSAIAIIMGEEFDG